MHFPVDPLHELIRIHLLTLNVAEKELRNQEPLIQSYVDFLIAKLAEKIDGMENGIVNIVCLQLHHSIMLT